MRDGCSSVSVDGKLERSRLRGVGGVIGWVGSGSAWVEMPWNFPCARAPCVPACVARFRGCDRRRARACGRRHHSAFWVSVLGAVFAASVACRSLFWRNIER